jgi:hypothetical protein
MALVASSTSVGWAVGAASTPTSKDAAHAREAAHRKAAGASEISARAVGDARGYRVGTARGTALARHDARRDALQDASQDLAASREVARRMALHAKRERKARKAH